MSDANDRTPAVGLFNYAHSYCSSAILLERANVSATHPEAPVYYLYYHSIELYLKSYLRAHGVSVEELAKKYGHHVRRSADKASEFGLVLRKDDDKIIDYMQETDTVNESRYIVTGYKPAVPALASVQKACRYLHKNIREKAYEELGEIRYPVLPD